MPGTQQEIRWIPICKTDDIVPNTGVCALVFDEQIAVFHVHDGSDRFFAIHNFDPNANAAVLSRGLVGNLGERIVVASPLYKHHFDLQTGECLEVPEHSVSVYPTRIDQGMVWVGA
ncbi:nitrite reductase small subunit NirD [Herbaspirillum sp. RTI4]|uniref:nitrite reductase small subunit NirD n=1 Tax=Herbaspirillum sp. RTI4 TaxID=3048640 RepID=UPI002AB35D69|nr:nitrite reductase small subunit NirD [Herbaspirillum sp. RTI4]MDY7578824.1 nitrite reductase small subunit NirD [Herbaspirillum sp. RTI4]MEA9982678.1 nitrite reductase small subunit NirD [Herbaspirillum sp. RTI4]